MLMAAVITSFRGGCLLYITDQPWDLPGQQQQLGQVAEQYFFPMPCPPPQQPPQMLHELSGPSQTLHMNPSQRPFADCPADASRPSVSAHPEYFSAVPALAEHSCAAEPVPYPYSMPKRLLVSATTPTPSSQYRCSKRPANKVPPTHPDCTEWHRNTGA